MKQAPDERSSGLPWPATWRGVYWFVLAVFAVWVGLLTWFTFSYA